MKVFGGLLLLLGLFSLVETEVVDSFAASCPAFFIKDQNDRPVTPTVMHSKVFPFSEVMSESRYMQICQKHKNNNLGGIWSVFSGREKRSSDECQVSRTSELFLFHMLGSQTVTDTDTETNNPSCYRYATLYDTKNKIPVYSAYLYTGYEKTERTTSWMIEPQVGVMVILYRM